MGGGGGGGGNPASSLSPTTGWNANMADWELREITQKDLLPEVRREIGQLNPFIDQTLNEAFDPQKQLYDRTLNRVTQQTRSGEAARGIADTPYGAAAEGNALGNFNIDWQNQQLQRELSGLGGAANVYGSIISSGATAAQPEIAAANNWMGLEKIGADAKAQDLDRQQQASQFQAGQIGQLGGMLGGLAGKGGG